MILLFLILAVPCSELHLTFLGHLLLRDGSGEDELLLTSTFVVAIVHYVI